MKNEIRKNLEKAIESLRKAESPASSADWLDFEMPSFDVDHPKVEAFGDYTTNAAMVLGKIAKRNPMEIAEKILPELNSGNFPELSSVSVFEKIEVVKPGYINFYLSKEYLQKTVGEINEKQNEYGNSGIGKGEKVNNEFISANPTGPLHLGNGRGGFLGDSIGRVLRKTGFQVTNEYYVNDAGEQVVKLGHSVKKDSEAAYAGEYIDELNEKFSNIEDPKEAGQKAAKIVLEEMIKKTVEEKMHMSFDHWASEKELYDRGYIDKALKILEEKKLTYENNGALWLKTTDFGDDKDRVLIKKDGQKTYFASDCGYLLFKMERGFARLIEIWGADHHGYISRFEAASRALGFEGDLKFIIVQLVRLMKDGREVRMSKRAGNVVYIDELIDKVGLDVSRFFFLMYSPDTHMNFDLGLAQEKSEKNPVYYVQYAHARICSIIAKREARNVKREAKANLSLLTHEKELGLMRELNRFPELVSEIAESYDVHKLPYYAIRLADKFHSMYNELIVLDEKNPELSDARLALVNAVKIVIEETLELMGVNAPEHM